jgi:hypothetical protein
MDETAVAYSYPVQRGTVIIKKWLPKGKAHKKQQLTTADVRGHITVMAFITHIPAVQAILPQILLGNRHKFTQAFLRSMAGCIPPNVHMWPGDSSWNNQYKMAKALKLLAKSLTRCMETYQPVLVLDCCRAHVCRALSLLATRLGIRLLFVPAKLTWLLQPADTHLFAKFKSFVRAAWALRWSEGRGQITDKEWAQMILDALVKVVRGSFWRAAFEEVGLLCNQQKLGAKLQLRLQLAAGAAVSAAPCDRPTSDQIRSVFPKRTKTELLDIFRWLTHPPEKCKKEKASVMSVDRLGDDDAGFPCHRTRSKTRKA